MIFEVRLTVPAGTAKSAPSRLEITVTRGVITRFGWFWPPGTEQLGHAVIRYQGRQLIPQNPDEDMTDDGLGPVFDTYLPLRSRPYRLTLEAWNDDDTYPHTVTVRFALVAEEDLPLHGRLARRIARALSLIAEVMTGERV